MRTAAGSSLGMAAALWGVGGFTLLLVSALWRLTPVAWEPVSQGNLGWGGAAAYAAFVLFNAWAEGYRGFQRRFSPMLAARAYHLRWNARPVEAALAPLFCMGLLWATRRRLVVSWVGLVAIAGLVAAVRQVPQPWRGIIDGGVVVGLAWGLVATLACAYRALGRGLPPEVDPQLPAG